MRIKLLSAIASFLTISFVMSSCLGNDEPVEYSPNALVQSFALDKVLGVNYLFTIDQLSGKIYNQDSLPVGSDTIIDRILITDLTTLGLVTIRNHDGTADSLFNISDSVNLVGTMEKPFKFKVWAPNAIVTKNYEIEVRVHQQQPDSLDWGKSALAINYAPTIQGKQKSIIFANQIFVYSEGHPVYFTSLADGKNWNHTTVNGLPNTNLTSLVVFMGKLFATVGGSTESYSSTDGVNWVKSTLGADIVTFISPINNTLTAIKQFNETNKIGSKQLVERFCTTEGSTWTVGDIVPENFPQNNISAALYKNAIGVENLMIVGNTIHTSENDTATVAWGYMEGQEWSELSTESKYSCPKFEDPSIIYYGGSFYIFGKSFTNFYKSVAGIVWKEETANFMFPESIRDKKTDYSMVVDNENRIWLMLDTPNEVWRGKLNRLGFQFQ